MLLRCALLVAIFVSQGSIAAAQEQYRGSGNPGHGSASFRTEIYDNGDSGDGNPFLDEALTVIEPVLILDYDITDRLSTHGSFSYDYVTSASIARLQIYEEQSGASGDTYYGLNSGLNYELSERTRLGGYLSGAYEYDYLSFGLGGSVSHDTAEHASTWILSSNGFFDIVEIVRFDGSQDEGSDNRISVTSTLSWYRLINRDTHGELGMTLSYQTGFLQTAFNSVIIEDEALDPNPLLVNNARGREITEELDSTRGRSTAFGQIRRSLGAKTSVGLSGRLYTDSWGIQSVTAEPRIYRWLMPETLQLRLRYRYYTQTKADAFQDRFTEEVAIRTQDSDLAAFDSQGGGVKLLWNISDSWSVDLMLDYIFRSDGIDSVFGGSGVRFRY